MLLWESFLTFLTVTTSSLGLTATLPAKTVGLTVIIVQGLNAATIVFKTGQWSPPPQAPQPPPTIIVQGQHSEPPG